MWLRVADWVSTKPSTTDEPRVLFIFHLMCPTSSSDRRRTSKTHAAGSHVPTVAISEKLACPNAGNNSRQRHRVANPAIGFRATIYRSVDITNNLAPFGVCTAL